MHDLRLTQPNKKKYGARSAPIFALVIYIIYISHRVPCVAVESPVGIPVEYQGKYTGIPAGRPAGVPVFPWRFFFSTDQVLPTLLYRYLVFGVWHTIVPNIFYLSRLHAAINVCTQTRSKQLYNIWSVYDVYHKYTSLYRILMPSILHIFGFDYTTWYCTTRTVTTSCG